MSARRRNNQKLKQARRRQEQESLRYYANFSKNYSSHMALCLMIRIAADMRNSNQKRAEFYDKLQEMTIEQFDTACELFQIGFDKVGGVDYDWQNENIINELGLTNDWHKPIFEALDYVKEMRADELRVQDKRSLAQVVRETPSDVKKNSILHQMLFNTEELVPQNVFQRP